MRSVAHKVKRFQADFSGLKWSILRTRIFWLVAVQTGLSLLAVVLFLVSGVGQKSNAYLSAPLWALALEPFLILGFFQLFLEVERQRVLTLLPSYRRVGFRNLFSTIAREKRRRFDELFGPQPDLETFAKSLIESWEWRRNILARAGEPAQKKAARFLFSLPTAGNFATYMTGLLAVVAGLVIVLIDKEQMYGSLGEFWSNFCEAFWLLVLLVVVPVTVSIFPLAGIWSALTATGNSLLEWLDDDFLSNSRFYGFIKDQLETDERKARRLLMRTTGWVYWSIQLGISPYGSWRKVWRNGRRSVRLARRRNAFR